MTTPNEEKYIKPIIAAHHHTSGVVSTLVENNVDKLPKQASFKRVTFGNSKGTVVETYIYERVPTVEEGHYGPSSYSDTREHQPVDTPPSKVKVRTLESQTPLYISPPSAVASVGAGKVNNISPSGVVIAEKRDIVSVASPLPSLQIMDEGSENPFRPGGQLSHEVDPIVKCYKTRPFPSTASSDLVDGPVAGVGSSTSPPSSPPGKKGAISSAHLSKNGGMDGVAAKPQDIKLTLTTADGRNAQLEVQHKQLMSPKAARAEVVHIAEKKKRCACCTIQ